VTVDRVFHNIPNTASFFNYDDKLDGLKYRYWLNLEIIDTENFNVIPYSESKVSFHTFVVSCINSQTGEREKYNMDPTENAKKMQILQKAIEKTDKTNFGAQITPEVIFKKVESGENKASKYISYIDKILAKTGLSDETTIYQYKEHILKDFFGRSKAWNWLTGEALEGALVRWLQGTTALKMTELRRLPFEDGEIMSPEQYAQIKDFEKDGLQDLLKAVLKPLDTLFIRVGNEAIKCIEGLANAGHEKEVVAKLRKELVNIKAAVENSDDAAKKKKLEKSLERLAVVDTEISATEGIVFKYKGHTLKLTGAFAPLNQIFGTRFYDKK
jgi:hypothetical protein